MIAEAIEKLEGLVEKSIGVRTVEDPFTKQVFWSKQSRGLERFPGKPGTEVPVRLTSLGSLQRLIDGPDKVDMSKHLIHVASPSMVYLESSCGLINPGERDVVASVSMVECETFRFNSYMSQEQFMIGLLSCFERINAFEEVAALVGQLENESVFQASDDGITQGVTIKKGAKLQRAVVKNKFTLNPYRTFHELPQPAGNYVLRVQRSGENPPVVALFEVNDGRWIIEAKESIAEYLRDQSETPLTILY